MYWFCRGNDLLLFYRAKQYIGRFERAKMRELKKSLDMIIKDGFGIELIIMVIVTIKIKLTGILMMLPLT